MGVEPKSLHDLARRLRLRRGRRDQLTIARKRHGSGFIYENADGHRVIDKELLRHFASLAMPPAYADVFFTAGRSAHLQAVGRDAAGRLQYRYHPDWEQIREAKKANRLTALIEVLPVVRRAVAQHLRTNEPTRSFALAAIIELVAGSAIRPGSEEYTKKHGTRGAATLLKSNVRVSGNMITLIFRGKGSKDIRKEFSPSRLASAIAVLKALPGKRLFQFRDEIGLIRSVSAKDANAFLREIGQANISLKDFRTLCASVAVLDTLGQTIPGASAAARNRQIIAAVKLAADELANTPAVCRRSYVQDAVMTAFEDGALERFAATLKHCRSAARREQFLARVISTASA